MDWCTLNLQPEYRIRENREQTLHCFSPRESVKERRANVRVKPSSPLLFCSSRCSRTEIEAARRLYYNVWSWVDPGGRSQC